MNISIPFYNNTGEKSSNVILKTSFDDLTFNNNLISQLVYAYQSNKRNVISSTKSRAQVAGTGKKPYRQKGTGHARFGSLRTPIHRGGGIAFGPKSNRNFYKKINKKTKNIALAQIISEKNNSKELFAGDKINLDKISTKQFVQKIPKIKFHKGSLLIIIDKYDKNIYYSSRNIPSISVIQAKNINIMDLLNNDNVFLTKESINTLQDRLNKHQND